MPRAITTPLCFLLGFVIGHASLSYLDALAAGIYISWSWGFILILVAFPNSLLFYPLSYILVIISSRLIWRERKSRNYYVLGLSALMTIFIIANLYAARVAGEIKKNEGVGRLFLLQITLSICLTYLFINIADFIAAPKTPSDTNQKSKNGE
jgi:hypothetical protein